jgi:hypothetical protein
MFKFGANNHRDIWGKTYEVFEGQAELRFARLYMSCPLWTRVNITLDQVDIVSRNKQLLNIEMCGIWVEGIKRTLLKNLVRRVYRIVYSFNNIKNRAPSIIAMLPLYCDCHMFW